MKRLAAVAFLLLGLAGCATDGTTNAAMTPAGYPEPVAMIVRQGGEAQSLGREYGMDGWLVKLGGSVRAMYVTPDGKGAVVGLLHGEGGENITVRQVEALARQVVADSPAPAVKPAEKVEVQPAVPAAPANDSDVALRAWAEASSLKYVSLGDVKAPVVYVMFDPRCPYCTSYLADLLDGPISGDKLNVRLLPVSVLGEESVKMAAGLLSAADPAEAFLRHAIGGGSVPEATADNMAAVRHNTEVMNALGLRSTPRTIYKTAVGEYGVMTGAPNDMAAFVKLVSGH